MRFALVTTIIATSSIPLAEAAPSPAEAFVGKLAALGCPNLSQLGPAFGPQSYVPKKDEMANLQPFAIPVGALAKLGVTKITIQLAFDIYHQTPSTVKDPSVGSIEIALDPRTDLDKVIGALPKATHFTVGTAAVVHAGNLYYKRGLLTFDCSSPPAWAQQTWTPADVKAMSDRVLAALDGKDIGMTIDPKEKGQLILTDERFEIGRYTNIDLFYVHFKTPMPAKALLDAVGASRVVLRSHDVHQSSWELEHPDGTPIRYHGWKLDFDVVDDKLEKSDHGPVLDLDKVLLTTLNGHQK